MTVPRLVSATCGSALARCAVAARPARGPRRRGRRALGRRDRRPRHAAARAVADRLLGRRRGARARRRRCGRRNGSSSCRCSPPRRSPRWRRPAARSWREVVAGALAWVTRFLPGLARVVVLTARVGGESRLARFGPGARGAVLAAVLLAIFVPLFVTADAAFAQIVDDAFGWEVTFDRAGDRVAVFLLLTGLTGALILASRPRPRRPRRLAPEPRPHRVADRARRARRAVRRLRRAAADDAVRRRRARPAHGRADLRRVRAPGLRAADGRRGADAGGDRARAARLARAASSCSALLCALTLVILASALKRLGLYEEAFGFTRLRLMAHGAILWLGGLFVLVAAAGALRRAALAAARDGRALRRRRARLRARQPRRADRGAQPRALREDGQARPHLPRAPEPGRGARARRVCDSGASRPPMAR